jgi:HAD superfamily hydrolase (TIGR01509 family)
LRGQDRWDAQKTRWIVIHALDRYSRSLACAMAPLPGLIGVLDWADRIGAHRAVVTNAPRANAEFVLAALGLTTRFETLVIGEELARNKPDPLPYATALARLGRPVASAVAFEDSRSGIAAARTAGLFTYEVKITIQENNDPA